MTKKLAESYKKAYGFWEVTTEGDCEGRSVSRLGIYEGYIDEIALALADRCYYSLCFRPIDPRALDLTPKRKSVEISFDIGSNTSCKARYAENRRAVSCHQQILPKSNHVKTRKALTLCFVRT